MERPVARCGARPIESLCLPDHEIRIEAGPSVDRALPCFDALETIAHDGFTGHLTSRDCVHQLRGGEPVELANTMRTRFRGGRDAHRHTDQFLPARAAELPAIRPNTAPEVRPDPPG